MRRDDTGDSADRDAFDDDVAELDGADATVSDSLDRDEPPSLDEDEEFLEADLGERDGDLDDDPDLDDDEPDLDDSDAEDEAELALLRDLGIDLDAEDEAPPELGLDAGIDGDDPADDEAAA